MEDELSDSLKTVAKGAGILFIGTFISKALMYLYRIVVAQWLGPADYGLLSMGLAVFWISVTVSNFGISGGIQRRITDYLGRGEENRIAPVVWSSLSITLPWSVLVALSAFLLADPIAAGFFQEPGLAPVIRVFAIAVPFQILYSNMSSIVEAFREMKYIAYTDKMFRSFFTLAATVLLLYLGFDLMGAIVAQLGAVVLTSLLILYYAEKRVYPVLRDRAGFGEREWLFHYSWPLLLSGIVGLAVGWTDTVLLGFFDTAERVGVYNAALPTAQLLTVFSGNLATVLFPTVSEMYGGGMKDRAVELTATSVKWIAMFTFPGVVLLVLFSPQILRLLFGNAYVGGSVALAVLGSAYFVQTITEHAGTFIKSEERTKLSLLNSVVIAVLNVGLNLLLIPYFQQLPNFTASAGAATATAFSLAFGGVLATAEAYYLFGVQPYRLRSFVPPVLATALSAGSVYLGLHFLFDPVPKYAVIPAFLVFGVLYAALYILFGGISDEDLEVLRAVDERTETDLEPVKRIVRKLHYARDRL